METLKRQIGDLNNKNFNTLNNSNTSLRNSIQITSLTEKTQSLSMISNNNYLTINDIMAFYDQLDQAIFDDQFKQQYIFSERKEFDNIQQIKDQRLLIEYKENCLVYMGLEINIQQLIVIKELNFYSEDQLIKSLDEFKIHYKINRLFLKDSLLLITPVQVSKHKQLQRLKAALERAECNLYQYSRQNKINEIEAFNIFEQILRQITNLHSVQIAHRDVKPQNIFYIQNKGWVLSDFGESLEYQELESIYNTRGTFYFFITQIQQYNKGNQKVQQNLLMNDLYALVVSIIMIQKKEIPKIQDIQQEVNNIKDLYLIQALKIQSFKQLQEFQEYISETKQKDINYDNFKLIYQCQIDPKQEKLNKIFVYTSWLQISEDNLWQICKNLLPVDVIQLKRLKLIKASKFTVRQQYFFKNFSKLSIRQLEIHIKMLSSFGYSETTMVQSQYILKHQYSQFIHLLLIDSLEKMYIPCEAEKQFKIFQQGLIFEQLDTEYQQKFLLKLSYYVQDQLYFEPGQKLDDFLTIQQLEYVNSEKLIQELNQNFDNLEISESLALLQKYIKEKFNIYTISNIQQFAIVTQSISKNNIYLYQLSIEMIFKLNPEVLDFNRRIAILYDLGQIYIFQENMKKFKKIVKKSQKYLQKTESKQQRIAFKIQILVLKLYQKCSHLYKIKVIKKIWLKIKRLDEITYNLYIMMIEEYLIQLLKLLYQDQYQQFRSNEIKVIIIIIHFVFKQKQYENKFEQSQKFHMMAQNLLIYQMNHRRCLKLIQDHKDQLTQTTISYFKLLKERRKELIFGKYLCQQPKLKRENEFLFIEYLYK